MDKGYATTSSTHGMMMGDNESVPIHDEIGGGDTRQQQRINAHGWNDYEIEKLKLGGKSTGYAPSSSASSTADWTEKSFEEWGIIERVLMMTTTRSIRAVFVSLVPNAAALFWR